MKKILEFPKTGRYRELSPDETSYAVMLYGGGENPDDIAQELGCSRETLSKAVFGRLAEIHEQEEKAKP